MQKREQGHIAKRGKGRYLIRWRIKDDLTGKTRQLSKVVQGDYGKAEAELRKKLNGTGEKGSDAPPPRTFGDYMGNEWAQYQRDHWKASTQVTQGSSIRRHIIPHFEGMLLSRITPTNISEFHTKMEEKGLGRKTRRNLHAMLAKMFAHAEECQLISGNPVKKGIAPRQEEKTEKPALSEEQLYALFGALPVRTKAFYLTLAFTGIRSGEALGLKWEDLDFAAHELHVRRAIYRGQEATPKTSGSIRPRPMVPELYRALLNHKAMAAYTRPSDYVFASSTGRPLNPDQLREALQATLKGLGIKFDQARADGMHLLRHTSGSLVYRRTANVKVAQEWLGHSSSRVTMDTYVHSMKDAQKQTAEAVFSRAVMPEANDEPVHQTGPLMH